MSETKVVEGMRCPFCGGVRTESPCEHCNPKVVRYETDISNIWEDENGWMVSYSDYTRLRSALEEM